VAFAGTKVRNAIWSFGYQQFFKRIAFRLDPEHVHDMMTARGRLLGAHRLTRAVTRSMFGFAHPMLEQTVAGIQFKNPIGLSAGFDKEGLLTKIIPEVGFGFMEVGSVTGIPCPGNPKPRLWRLKKSRSIAVFYGLKNDGSTVIAERLRQAPSRFPIGISIAKANVPTTDSIEAGIADYVMAARALVDLGTYITINISCPNTSGGEPFVEAENLERLLTALDPILTAKPTFIKLPADIELHEIDEIIAVADKHHVTGFICTNLTKSRQNPKIIDQEVPAKGGLSGKVVEERSNNILRYVRQRVGNRYVLIGVGGVFTAADAYKKIRLGASLIQLITGMIYEGPQVISQINLGLVQLLKRDGYTNISQAVGVDVDKKA